MPVAGPRAPRLPIGQYLLQAPAVVLEQGSSTIRVGGAAGWAGRAAPVEELGGRRRQASRPSRSGTLGHPRLEMAEDPPAVRRAAPSSISAHARRFFFQAEDGIRDLIVTGVQTCALPI